MISAEEFRAMISEKKELHLNLDECGIINDIVDFKKSLESIQTQLHEINSEKFKIYHYTSGEGLKGIIENKELWFTNADFLNDRTEIQHTHILIDKVLDGFRSEKNQDEIEEFKGYIHNYVKPDNRIYSASFSLDKDSNLLWANYATDDGYNIEFDINKLDSILVDCNNDDDGVIFGRIFSPVNYDEKMQKKLLQTELISLYKIFKYCKENDMNEFLELSETNRINIILYSLFFKRKEFVQEQEFRTALICVDDSKKADVLKVRIKNGACIPYAAISIASDKYKVPIKSITIGPKNNLDIAENGLRYLLKWNGFEKYHVTINKSKIPYRY